MTTKEEILLIKKDISNINDKIDNLDEKLDKMMKKLLDPDSGLVVKVNKNTERLDERDANLGGWLKNLEEFKSMKKWKVNITKALWVVYTAIIGFLIKLIWG